MDEQQQQQQQQQQFLSNWITHESYEFHYFHPEEAVRIRRALLDWYYEHRRKLPWRGDPPPYEGSTAAKNYNTNNNNSKNNNKTTAAAANVVTVVKDYNSNSTAMTPQRRSAYGIWVSEIMLQQTRVEAVIPYWLAWMEAFPTIQVLAESTNEQVNARWAGLGFYNRARLLHSAARYVCQHHDGQLPQTVKELQAIPGIGPYTASAIASIAFGIAVPVVDGNVCRVLSRLRGVAQHIKAPIFKDKYGWELAGQIVNATTTFTDVPSSSSSSLSSNTNTITDAGDVNQAMMELGATYCAPSGTGIDEQDPLKEFYWSTRLGAAYYQQVMMPSTAATDPSRRMIEELVDRASQRTADVVVSTTTTKKKEQPVSCVLCDKRGVPTVLAQLAESIEQQTVQSANNGNKGSEGNNMLDISRKCGHSVFPMAPPKQTKREEVLSVAVLSTTTATNNTNGVKDDNNDSTYWLLVKRPEKGLLAGQWEFPSTCVWSSDYLEAGDDAILTTLATKNVSGEKGVKRKALTSSTNRKKAKTDGIDVPVVKPAVRKKALKSLMEEILSQNTAVYDEMKSVKLTNLQKASPIEHIFSHVRHTMWIEQASITISAVKPTVWVSTTGREVRWMRESDMAKAGVTSGVKKILKAVKDELKTTQTKQGFFAAKPKKI